MTYAIAYQQIANRGGRNRRCLMKKLRMSLMASGLMLAVAAGLMTDARAGVRVAASVHTPNVSIHAGYNPSCYYCIGQDRRIQDRRYMGYEITRRDRMIARRMTWYTGVNLGELIRLRRHGYDWFEIGRWLHMPRPVVRAAMNQKSWNRFLREERMNAHRYGKRKVKVTYYDGREYRRR
jgi:hypothetical protein